VPLKHGNEFRAALDKSGKTYEWVVYPEEGHGFNKDENRFDFYRRVDGFMKRYLQ
jgi:dipeptidyl aminopeptidase/acylaminoacyl peptidase